MVRSQASLTRRQFLFGSAAVAGVGMLGPLTGRIGAAFGAAAVDPSTALRNRLVVLYQQGGNDGLNLVAPRGDVAGAPRYSVYRKVRPSIAHAASATLPLDRPATPTGRSGSHPRLARPPRSLRRRSGRDRPGRRLPRPQLLALRVDRHLAVRPPRLLVRLRVDRAAPRPRRHRRRRAPAPSRSGPSSRWRCAARRTRASGSRGVPLSFADGRGGQAMARHAALRGFGEATWPEPVRQYAADQGGADGEHGRRVATPRPVPVSTDNPLANALLNARTLLTENLGVEVVFVSQGGYDTHAGQRSAQDSLFSQLDGAIEAFFQARWPAPTSASARYRPAWSIARC